MDCALSGGLRASPSDPPAQAPCGVGCGQRPTREHERPAPRHRVRSFPATCDPAGNTTSADFSTAHDALTSAAVHHHPAIQPDGASETPVEISLGKTSNLHRTPTTSTRQPLDGHRASPCVAGSPRPPRLIRGCCSLDCDFVYGFLPTQPHSCAVALDLWLVPSTSTEDSHLRAASHARHTTPRRVGACADPNGVSGRLEGRSPRPSGSRPRSPRGGEPSSSR